MKFATRDMMEVPVYGTLEAAQYLRVPHNTLVYWVKGSGTVPPLIRLASTSPSRLSFLNLLECHVLSGMRAIYNVRIPKVRKALRTLARYIEHEHPLIQQVFHTDRRDLFIEHLDDIVNLSQGGQIAFRSMVELHLERIERDPKGLFRFYPFVMERSAAEPKLIQITPAVGFGKPVIAGTGISTAVIASRFNARESVDSLSVEYALTPQQIEEAVRWEQRTAAVAA